MPIPARMAYFIATTLFTLKPIGRGSLPSSHRLDPGDRGQVRRRMPAVGDEPMAVEVVQRLGSAEPAHVARRGVGAHLHGEQRPADEVGVLGLARPDGDVGGAHGDVDLVVVEDEVDADLRIELHELAQPLRDPHRAEADGRGDAIRRSAWSWCRRSAFPPSAVCS